MDRWASVRDAVASRSVDFSLGGILLLATALRVVGLDRWNPGLDEIYTIGLRSPAALSRLLHVGYDPHPPLYFLLVRLWATVVGWDPVAVRSLSLVFGVASVYATFALGRHLYGDRAGLLAATLLAVAPVQVHYGWTARMYALLTLLTAGSLYFFVRLHEEDPAVESPYVLLTAAALYTHVYAVFVVLGQTLAVALARSGPASRVDRRRLLELQALVTVLYLPWLVVLSEQLLATVGLASGGSTPAVGWIPEPSLGLLVETVHLYAGNPYALYPITTDGVPTVTLTWAVVFVYVAALVLALFVEGRELPADRRAFVPLAVLVLSPILVPFAASYLLEPVFFPRFTLVAMVPLVVLVGRGLTKLEPTALRYAVVAFLVVTSVGLTGVYYDGYNQEPFRESTAFLERWTDGDDLVVVQPAWLGGGGSQLYYYYDGNATVVPVDRESVSPDATERLRGTVADHDRACLYQYQYGDADPAVRNLLTEAGDRVSGYRKGWIAVTCYDRQ